MVYNVQRVLLLLAIMFGSAKATKRHDIHLRRLAGTTVGNLAVWQPKDDEAVAFHEKERDRKRDDERTAIKARKVELKELQDSLAPARAAEESRHDQLKQLNQDTEIQLTEKDTQIDCSSLEKDIEGIKQEISNHKSDLQRYKDKAVAFQKKELGFAKTIADHKLKETELQHELDDALREGLTKEDLRDALLKDLMESDRKLDEEMTTITARKVELMELQDSLAQARAAEESEVQSLHEELNQLKQETETALKKKDRQIADAIRACGPAQVAPPKAPIGCNIQRKKINLDHMVKGKVIKPEEEDC